MAEKMLVTQALDEKGLLVKKIEDKIRRLAVVDLKKKNEDKVSLNRTDAEEFAKDAEAAWQQINDLIDRFQKLDAAIVQSNAATMVETSYGQMSVAGAISFRNRLRSTGAYEGTKSFESQLYAALKDQYDDAAKRMELRNKELGATAESMRLSILGKDAKAKDDKPLAVVDTYVDENTTELVDPLDVKEKIAALKEKRETLISELDTQIKVSNATTFVEF